MRQECTDLEDNHLQIAPKDHFHTQTSQKHHFKTHNCPPLTEHHVLTTQLVFEKHHNLMKPMQYLPAFCRNDMS